MGWTFGGIFCNSKTPMEWAFSRAFKKHDFWGATLRRVCLYLRSRSSSHGVGCGIGQSYLASVANRSRGFFIRGTALVYEKNAPTGWLGSIFRPGRSLPC
jgi:hypothetical protein